MKKTIGKRLLSSVTALLIAATYVLPSGLVAGAAGESDDLIYPARADVTQSGVDQTALSVPTDLITLLAGTDTSRGIIGDTLEETIENYKSKYLLGVAADFSVYLREDFIVYDSDAEGRIAIGGNYVNRTKYDSYAVGKGDYAHKTPLEDLLNNDGFAHAIIGGSMERGEPANGAYDGDYAYGKAMLNGLYYSGDGAKRGENPGDGYDGTKATAKLVLQTYENNANYAGWTAKQKYDDFVSAVNSDYPLTNYDKNGNHLDENGRILWDGYGGGWVKLGASQTYFAQLLDFDTRFDSLIDRSAEMKGYGDLMVNDTAIYMSTDPEEPNTIIFEYTGDADELDCVFFNMTEEEWEMYLSASTVKFIGIPDLPDSYGENGRPVTDNEGNMTTWQYSYIIVNVGANAKVDDDAEEGEKHLHIVDPSINGGSNKTYINGIDISKKNGDDTTNNYHGVTSLLYNFYALNADDNLVLGNNFSGTIFAPTADVIDEWLLNLKATGTDNKDMHGHLSGALIANSFEGATEFGYRPFDGPTFGVTTTDKIYEYAVTLDKVDQDGNALSGATFDLYKKNDETGNYDKIQGNISAGSTVIEGLKPGEYYLEETGFPEGAAVLTGEDAKTYFEIKNGEAVTARNVETGKFKPNVAITYTHDQVKADSANKDKYIPLTEPSYPTWPDDFNAVAAMSGYWDNDSGWLTPDIDLQVKVTFIDKDGTDREIYNGYAKANNWNAFCGTWGDGAANTNITKFENVETVIIEASTNDTRGVTVSFAANDVQSEYYTLTSTPQTITINVAQLPSAYYKEATDADEFKAEVEIGDETYTVVARQGDPYKVSFSGYTGTLVVGGEEYFLNPLAADSYDAGGTLYTRDDLEALDGIIAIPYSYTINAGEAGEEEISGYIYAYWTGSGYAAAKPVANLGSIEVENEIENTEYATISIEKKWTLNGKADTAAHDAVTVKVTVKKNGTKITDEEYAKLTGLTKQDDGYYLTLGPSNWRWTSPAEALEKDDANTQYTVEVEEVNVPDDYVWSTQVGTTDTNNTANVIITNNKDTVDLKVNKTWVNKSGWNVTFPTSITVTVTGTVNGQIVYGPQNFDLSHDGGTIKDLNKTYKGDLIEYTVTEVVPEGYEKTESPNGYIFNITNTYKQKSRYVSVEKKWTGDTEADADGLKMTTAKIKVKILQDGNDVTAKYSDGLTYDAAGDYYYVVLSRGYSKWTSEKLPAFTFAEAGDTTHTYTVEAEELEVPGYYDPTTSGTDTDTIITNAYKNDDITLTGTKTWNDLQDTAGKRPSLDGFESWIVVERSADGGETYDEYDGEYTFSYADGTDQSDDSWSFTITGLPTYDKDGGPYIYRLVEDDTNSDYYELDEDASGSTGNSYTFVNNLLGDDAKVSVKKEWKGTIPTNYQPRSVKVKIAIIRNDGTNDEDVTSEYATSAKLTAEGDYYVANLTSTGNWTWEFSKLPKYGYADDGVTVTAEYTYKVEAEELEVPPYFSKAYTGNNTAKVTITNTYNNGTVEVEAGNKIWADSSNKWDTRPGDDEFIANWLTVTNNFGETVAAANVKIEKSEDSNTWTVKVVGLKKYAPDGTEYTYSISEEVKDERYEKTVDATTGDITNTLKDGDTFSVSVEKKWNHKENAVNVDDDVNPLTAKFEITIIGIGEDGQEHTVDTLTVALTGNDKWERTDLPEYGEVNGKGVIFVGYYVKVTEKDIPDGYTAGIDDSDPTAVVVTNTFGFEQDYVDLKINKTWVDEANKWNTRPETVNDFMKWITITQNGKDYTLTEDNEVTLTIDGNDWFITIANLPKIDSATLTDYVYDISESIPADKLYEKKIENKASAYVFELENDLVYEDVNVKKVDDAGKPVKRAKLAIYTESGELVAEWTTGETGVEAIIGKLVAGQKYVLKEIEAPKGYVKAKDITFTAGTDTDLTMVDAKIVITISVAKVDENGNPLKGAKFDLIDKETGKTIHSWESSDESNEDIAEYLETGKTYIIRETEAPSDDYEKISGDIEFTVNDDGSITLVKDATVPEGVELSRDVITVTNKLKNDEDDGDDEDDGNDDNGDDNTGDEDDGNDDNGDDNTGDEDDGNDDDGDDNTGDEDDGNDDDGDNTGDDGDDSGVADGGDDSDFGAGSDIDNGNGTDDDSAPKTGDPINGALPMAAIALAAVARMLKKKEDEE